MPLRYPREVECGVPPLDRFDHGLSLLVVGKDLQLDYAIDYLAKEIGKEPRDLCPAPPIVPRPLQPLR